MFAVSAPRAKVFEYEVEVDRHSTVAIPAGSSFSVPADWTPDHLLLAALVRCSIASLEYHAKRAGHETRAIGSARGTITRRESDGRYAFSGITLRIEAVLTPPAGDGLAQMLEKAERDCFVGASLAISPRYDWDVS